ncbi:MAG: hypothetical protein COW71_15305 [Ignavibacteriales bacterium CG18_big_fil_WC_8_21_14_2_50_31_20]|nr:MAG: hypothetical protein COW71_15305 [Ignavibacteriales bacterium CG18_big_fil_WC_8_21_14_2_50_31_20]
MDNEIIKAYLWQEVIRLGFSPSSERDRKNWLFQFGRSLKDFWEIEEYPPTPTKNSTFAASLTSSTKINMLIDYSISNLSKYTVKFLYIPSKQELIWKHDVDTTYFLFPKESILNKFKKLQQAKKEFKNFAPIVRTKIIKNVSDGLLFHPAVHQHIDSPIDEHEMRIGGGIDNPFVFLFHLRYQLCPDKDKRNKEKERLAQLFEETIKNDSIINASDLLNTKAS